MNNIYRIALALLVCVMLGSVADVQAQSTSVAPQAPQPATEPASNQATAPAADVTNALASYIAKADNSYGWTVRQKTRLALSDCIELTLTSQTWKNIVWKHRLFLIIPDNVKAKTDALFVIEGGGWRAEDGRPPVEGKAAYPKQAILLALLAQQMQAPVVIVLNVPQQPIFNGKREDQIIAYTFDQFLKTGKADWPLLLPMVKSAVRAMDATQAYAKEERNLTIDRFTVTGASKRGWTTWLTAASDSRVMALAPMVIDMLNMASQFAHQEESWGKLSPRIRDYTDINLSTRLDSPRGKDLIQMVDPYAYREKITQPKLILLGTNDGFWTLDALNIYWDGLTGDKFIVYVPNADHDLSKDWVRVFGGIAALRQHALKQQAMPAIKWQHEQNPQGNVLKVEPGEKPMRVVYWSANSPTRDFRKAKWVAQDLAPQGDGSYEATTDATAAGYNAGYVEVSYSRPVQALNLSTTIRIVGPLEANKDKAEAAGKVDQKKS